MMVSFCYNGMEFCVGVLEEIRNQTKVWEENGKTGKGNK